MRKFVSAAILLLFLYSIVGYFPVFLILQDRAKEEMVNHIKCSLHEDELSIIQVTKSDYNRIEWMDKGEEFIYKGEMMDLVKKQTDNNGNIILYAIDDKKEDGLYSELNDATGKNMNDQVGGKKAIKTFKLFSGKYLACGLTTWLLTPGTPIFTRDHSGSFESITPFILTPPPETGT